MFVNCKALERGIEIKDFTYLARLLKEGDLITPSGDLKEELKISMGGAFFGEKDLEGPVFPWIFSTFDLDRDEEKIDPAGWDLKNYLKNPVILWAHDSRIPAIGVSRDTAVRNGVLGGNISFNSRETDPFGWGIGQRVADGVIRAGSVGFMVNKVEILDSADGTGLIFREQELLEFSICNIPSNPYALNLQRDKVHSIPEVSSFWSGLIRH